ncbi:MAG: UbiD family decarboxylase [Acidisphaera sp.]|nr:UbiD family decarboxylase [Acidisphaera sp.]
MSRTNADFTLQSFIERVASDDPDAVWRITDRVNLDSDVTAIAMELERLGRSPVLWFDSVGDYPFPVVCNLFADRRRYALGLDVPVQRLIADWGALGDKRVAPVMRDRGPIHDVVLTGKDVDLGRLPIMLHFECDAGRYITNGIVIAKDPDSGVRNASFHRMQVKGRDRLGTSLHSRRHLWNYMRRYEERGEDMPVSIIVGGHPTIIFGALWKGPITTDEYEVMGGMMGVPLEIAAGLTVPIEAPIHAEIVIEGRILGKAREPEGPFAEFTGYASKRSTEHVIEVSAIMHRRRALYHDIIPGISDEHTSLLAVPQEARLLRLLHTHYPNVTDVAYPKSGTCRLHAYVAVRQPAPGLARLVAAAAFGDDLSLKLVVVVDDDVDVHNDSDVLWAMATRMQADQDIDVMRNGMGAILDPSNRDGLTAKMVIDATCPAGDFPQRHTLDAAAVARARTLIEGRFGRGGL